MDKKTLNIKSVRDGIIAGHFTAHELTTEYLAEAEVKNPEIKTICRLIFSVRTKWSSALKTQMPTSLW